MERDETAAALRAMVDRALAVLDEGDPAAAQRSLWDDLNAHTVKALTGRDPAPGARMRQLRAGEYFDALESGRPAVEALMRATGLAEASS